MRYTVERFHEVQHHDRILGTDPGGHLSAAHDDFALLITPEGTRSRVDKWKTGFLRIAQIAQMPVVQVSWDYPTRTVQLGPEAKLTGDTEVDIAAIRAHFRQFSGRNPENQSP